MIYPIISKIKAHFVFWVALLFTTGLSAQQPQPVPSLVKEIKSKEWYEEQANAWKKITQRNPKDAAAWFNYYMANRMMRIYDEAGDVQPTDRFKVLNGIVDQMKKHESISYYALVHHLFVSDQSRTFTPLIFNHGSISNNSAR